MNELVPINNSNLFSAAKESMKGRWGEAIVTSIVIGVVVGALPGIGLIIAGPIYLGAATWALKYIRKEEYEIGDVFSGFSNFVNAFVAALLIGIIISVGIFILIVPGIIAALGLSQTFFIMSEDSKISPTDAMSKSWEMMKGYKAKLFGIYIYFILLGIACIFTLGIGFFFLIPYQRTVLAMFYERITGGPKPQDEIAEIGTE